MALQELVPTVELRNYVRHLYTNFKTKPNNKGKTLKDCLWRAVRATYSKEYDDTMNETRSLSEATHKWSEAKDVRH